MVQKHMMPEHPLMLRQGTSKHDMEYAMKSIDLITFKGTEALIVWNTNSVEQHLSRFLPFPTLQGKMGSLFKPMLPLTHIHDQEPSLRSAKLQPPSQTDSSPHLEFMPTTPLLTNGEPA